MAAGLAVGGLTAYPAGTAAASSSTCGGSGSVSTVNGTLADGATYLLECPAGNWNGTLYLYSHGYVAPGDGNPAQDAGDQVTHDWMLGHGYALAGSSYASTGWAIAQALPDQINTLNAFDGRYGQPKTTVAWGHSLGGIITAGLIQDYPKPVRRRAAHVRRAVRRRGHLEHRARRGVRVPEADRPRGPDRQHHRPRGQPGGRRGWREPRLSRPRRARPASPWSRRWRTPPAGSPRVQPNPPPTTTPPRRPTSSSGARR